MDFKITCISKRLKQSQLGATIVEVVVASAIGSLAFLITTTLTVFTSKSFAALGNYYDMNEKGMHALDVLSKEIRQANRLTSFSTNQLTFDVGTTNPLLTYAYSPERRTLVRTQGKDSKVLLTDCTSLQFSIYQRTPIAGTYDQYPVATVTNCKVVSVQWTCSKDILKKTMTSDTELAAKIVIRKF